MDKEGNEEGCDALVPPPRLQQRVPAERRASDTARRPGAQVDKQNKPVRKVARSTGTCTWLPLTRKVPYMSLWPPPACYFT